MRSRSMHWLLETAGLKPKLLSGGYKAFRNLAQTRFAQEWPLKVVSGLTGAGKTRILNVLAEHGESVIDLEGLANHRGSAFGAIGQNEPPTTEQFENLLFAELEQCSDAKRIWVEDEGNRLGTVVVPPAFIKQLKNSSAVFIDLSPAARVENLMDDYGDLSPDKLCESVQAIRKRLGFDLAQAATDAIESGEIKTAIEIVLGYYDRTYTHAAAKFPRPPMKELAIEGLTNQQLVDQMTWQPWLTSRSQRKTNGRAWSLLTGPVQNTETPTHWKCSQAIAPSPPAPPRKKANHINRINSIPRVGIFCENDVLISDMKCLLTKVDQEHLSQRSSFSIDDRCSKLNTGGLSKLKSRIHQLGL